MMWQIEFFEQFEDKHLLIHQEVKINIGVHPVLCKYNNKNTFM